MHMTRYAALAVALVSIFVFPHAARSASGRYLARGGSPEAVIVLGERATPLHRFAAGELRRYLAAVSGASLEILGADQFKTSAGGMPSCWAARPTVPSSGKQRARRSDSTP